MERQLLNEAFSLVNLHENSTIFVPFVPATSISSPLLPGYNPTSRYHSSALLGAFLDSATLPYRLKTSPSMVSDLVSQLNWRNGSRMADATLLFPFPRKTDHFLEDSFADPARLAATTFLLSGQAPLKAPLRASSENLILRGLSNVQLFAKWDF